MLRQLLSILVLLAVFFAPLAPLRAGPAAASLEERAQGLPRAGVTLPAEAYQPVRVRKLAHPKGIWFNTALLREMGYEVPPEREILDSLGYAIPQGDDPPEAFTEETRTFYADGYGGSGIGHKTGSNRAAVAGEFQIKGVGMTGRVDPGDTDYGHLHGGASIEEAIREAIWGEINHQELPYGGNRVLAIIDTGTYTYWPDGTRERRALIIRQDPLRPAHFMSNAKPLSPAATAADEARADEAVRYLASALDEETRGKRKGPKKELERIERGLGEYARRLARQFAAAFARRFYHGATSESNIELGGAFLDYGTQTALSGYGKARILKFNDPFGEIQEFSRRLIRGFIEEVRVRLGAEDQLKPKRFDAIFRDTYDEALRREMLELTGAPPELVARIEGSKSARKLFAALMEVATSGAREVSVDKAMPAKLTDYDLGRILAKLGGEADSAAIEQELPSPELRKRLVEAYSRFVEDLRSEGGLLGISGKSLRFYMKAASALRNRDTPSLYRHAMREANVPLIDRYLASGDPGEIRASIEERISEGIRTPRGQRPFELVLQETIRSSDGIRTQTVFDARSGERILRIQVPIPAHAEANASFYGNSLPARDLREGVLRYTTDHWRSQGEVQARVREGFAEFEIPVVPGSESAEIVLRSADGSRWWKQEGDNVRLSVARDGQAAPCRLREILFRL